MQDIFPEIVRLVTAQQHGARLVQAGKLNEQQFSEFCRDLLQKFIQAIPDDVFHEMMGDREDGRQEGLGKSSPPPGYVEHSRVAGMPGARKARLGLSAAEEEATDSNGILDLDEAEALERRGLYPGRKVALREDLEFPGRKARSIIDRWING